MKEQLYELLSMNGVYRTAYAELYNRARRHVSNKTDIDDLVQETFYRAIIGIDTFKGELTEKTLQPWLNKILVNTTVDNRRRNRKRNTTEYYHDELTEIPIKNAEVESEQREEQEKQKEVLYTHVKQLPSTYRTCIMLFYLCNVPQKTIAEMLNIEPPTVRTRIHTGRQYLKQMYQQNAA